jgi:hypothetical protein
VAARLADVPGVLIGTTNQAQGLEREAEVQSRHLGPSAFGARQNIGGDRLLRNQVQTSLPVRVATLMVEARDELEAVGFRPRWMRSAD